MSLYNTIFNYHDLWLFFKFTMRRSLSKSCHRLHANYGLVSEFYKIVGTDIGHSRTKPCNKFINNISDRFHARFYIYSRGRDSFTKHLLSHLLKLRQLEIPLSNSLFRCHTIIFFVHQSMLIISYITDRFKYS